MNIVLSGNTMYSYWHNRVNLAAQGIGDREVKLGIKPVGGILITIFAERAGRVSKLEKPNAPTSSASTVSMFYDEDDKSVDYSSELV